MEVHDLTEATVAIRVALMKEDYDLATIDARVLQATLEDLYDKGYILVQKDDLLDVIEDGYCSSTILEQLGIKPKEEV